jgi:putative hemolysin
MDTMQPSAGGFSMKMYAGLWKISILALFTLIFTSCASPAAPTTAPAVPTQAEAQPTTPPAPTEAPQLANPASVNCINAGGKLTIEERGDGGQFGVCYLEDNRQCEEWALLNGACPANGVKVTGFITAAARYCAIIGGEYAATANSGADNEQGTCTFKNGTQCDAQEYYDGKCSPETAPTASASGGVIHPMSMEVCDGQAQAMMHYLDTFDLTQSEAPLEDSATGKSGTGCMSTVTGTGAKYKSPMDVLQAMATMLVKDEGWTEDIKLQAGGPTGIGAGYRKDNQVCLVSAMWLPDASAKCPNDQPISACNVKPEQQNYTITLNCGIEE